MLEKKEKLSAVDLKALKAKVKAEMQRRKYSGSLEAYGAAEYDYTVIPASGKKILPEHANKIIEPMNAVNTSGFIEQKSKDKVIAMNQLNAKVTAYAAEAITSTNHYCSGLCSGLCSASCGGDCSGSCTDGCANSCTGNCQGCTGTCEGCTGTCSGQCGDATECTGYCWSQCTTTCKGGCKTACKDGNCQGWCWDVNAKTT